MKKKTGKEAENITFEDYKKLVEDLRVRLNVLNASVFLLEDKLMSCDMTTANYLNKINNELEVIRKLILAHPIQHRN